MSAGTRAASPGSTIERTTPRRRLRRWRGGMGMSRLLSGEPVSEGGDLREVFASKLHEIIRATFAVLESAQAGQDNERAQKARKFLHDTAVFFAEMEATARERQF